MKKERILKAIEIIEFAIKNNISVREASVKSGFANTYVKNVKAIVYEKYNEGDLELKLFKLFEEAYKRYLENRKKIISQTNNTKENTNLNDVIETNKPKDLPKVGNRETFNQKNNNEAEYEWVGSSNYPKDHVRTLEQLLAATEIDTEIWKPVSHIVNKWDVTMKVNEGDEIVARTYQNWQVKARLERNISTVREKAIGEIFQEMTLNYQPPITHTTPKDIKTHKENNLFEVTLFDLHIGKLAWGGETGENFDTKIARRRYLKTIEKLIERASGFEFSKILFPIGSDFFNSDTIYNTTTKGTPQDEDLRWQKTFKVGTQLLVDAINMLKETGVPVDVVVIPGNHDFERSYYLGEYLAAWFNIDPMVNINNGASPRKYYRFGKVLIGLTHGSEEKEASLPLLMASDIESKPLWSETLFHEWHLGHIHRKRDMKYIALDKSRMTNEDLGVTVRYLSSLTGTEEWHHKKGFVGATKAGEAFIWNDKTGMIAHLNSNLII